MRAGIGGAHRAAHYRRAFFDDVKSAWDDMFGLNDDEEDEKGNGKGKDSGPGRKTEEPEEQEPTQIIVTRTTQATITAPAITRTQKGPEPKSTLVVAETTTFAKGVPLSGTNLPTAVVPTMKSDQALESTLAIAPDTTSSASTTIDRGNLAGATAATTKPTAEASSNDEASAGTKAGIAIGVLAGLLALFVLVWFIFTKRKKQLEKEKQRLADDEKINGPFSDSAAIKTPATAPRLSLRPVTQFIPNLMAGGEKQAGQSGGAMLGPSAAQASPLNRPAGASAWERPTADSLHNSSPWDRPSASPTPSGNPFNDSQRMVEDPNQIRPVSPLEKDIGTASTTGPPQPVSPIQENALPAFPTPGAAEAAAAGAVAGAAVGAAGAGLVRKASMRKDVPKPLDLTRPPPLGGVPPSPAGTEYSMNSVAPGQTPGMSPGAAAIAAAGGPAESTVHRVQLDFKPTLEDELELKAGELVRLLHEYDDGWALCIRLDRSRQGVVPRTCLSVRPVKPRPPPNGGPRGPPVNPQRGPGPNYQGPPQNRGPRGPPNGQYPRPGSANGQYGRPGSANGQYGRPGSAGGQYPRPGSAAGRPYDMRSQSPGPNGRSQSPAGMNRRMSPPGPSGMNQQYRPGSGPQGPPNGPIERRPVPGQAY
ncbi:variant SH3 domain containing protein [Naviculisporaceae sp. PSN 640]